MHPQITQITQKSSTPLPLSVEIGEICVIGGFDSCARTQ